jgi:hypothetical protein
MQMLDSDNATQLKHEKCWCISKRNTLYLN